MERRISHHRKHRTNGTETELRRSKTSRKERAYPLDDPLRMVQEYPDINACDCIPERWVRHALDCEIKIEILDFYSIKFWMM